MEDNLDIDDIRQILKSMSKIIRIQSIAIKDLDERFSRLNTSVDIDANIDTKFSKARHFFKLQFFKI